VKVTRVARRAPAAVRRDVRRTMIRDILSDDPTNNKADGRKCPTPNGLRLSCVGRIVFSSPNSPSPRDHLSAPQWRNAARVTFTTGC